MRRSHLGVYGVFKQNNKILLIKKATGPYMGLLDLPGGTIEFGEKPEQALEREMLEETGLNIVDSKLYFCDSVCFPHNATSDGTTVELHHICIAYNVAVEDFQNIKTDPDGLDSDGALWFDLSYGDMELLAPFAKMACTV